MRVPEVDQRLGVKVGNLVSQDNLVLQSGILKVNLHLLDKADNLVLHADMEDWQDQVVQEEVAVAVVEVVASAAAAVALVAAAAEEGVEVNLHLVDKVDNLVLHHNDLERESAG